MSDDRQTIEEFLDADFIIPSTGGSLAGPPRSSRTIGSLTAHDIGHTITVRDTTGKLRRVEHLPDGRSIIQVSAFPESFFTNEPCEVEGT